MIAAVRQWRKQIALDRLKAISKATSLLYAAPHPFQPLRRVNALQCALPVQLPRWMRLIVPACLFDDGALRLREVLYGNAISNWVQESILLWADDTHRASLLLPPQYLHAWGGPVARLRSVRLFVFFLANQLQAGLRRFSQLSDYAASGPGAPDIPYVVALKTPAGCVHLADHGGVLPWLKSEAAFGNSVERVWVSSPFLSQQDCTDHPAWVQVADLPFPRLSSVFDRAVFRIHAVWLIAVTIFVGSLGGWQAAVLLTDLLDAAYVRRIQGRVPLIGVASFLGDMSNRYLWICQLEQIGVLAPLIHYASSYTPFHYGSGIVEPDIVPHELLAHHWVRNWYQTQQVAEKFAAYLARTPVTHGKRIHQNVGAFDMIDNGMELSWMPPRALVVFDVEPSRRLTLLTRAGYIFAGNDERRVLVFWQNLADLANELDLVLVHKIKRRPSARIPSQYRSLLHMLKSGGRYVDVSPDTGVMRLLQTAKASVSLPFTSVCDVALSLGRPATYVDFTGTIQNPEQHAMGSPVAQSKSELRSWLKKHYS